MRSKSFMFLSGSILFLLGISLADFSHYRPEVLLIALGLILLAANLSKSSSFVCFLIGVVFLGMFYSGFYRKQDQPRDLVFNQKILIEGSVSSYVEAVDGKQKLTLEVLKPDWQTALQVQGLSYPRVFYGDKLVMETKVIKPEKFADFDYPLYLQRQGIYGIIRNPQNLRILNHSSRSRLVKLIYLIRSKFEESIRRSFPEPQASLATGIILGSKSQIPDQLLENFNRTGLTHIIAVSGSNLTIIVSVLVGLGIGRTIKFRYWALVIFISFFVILTGASASVVRGGLIAWLLVWARANSRIAWPLPLLILAVLLMTLANPVILLHDIGFQLSVAAFTGLLFIAPKIKNWSRFPLKNLAYPAIDTIAAGTLTLPLTFYYFHQISLIFILANLLVLWTVPVIMALGFLAGIFGLFNQFLGQILAQPAILIENYLIWVVNFLGNLSIAAIKI